MLLRRSCWFVLGVFGAMGCDSGTRPDVFAGSTDIQFTRFDGGYILPDGRIVFDDAPETSDLGATDVSASEGGGGGDGGPVVGPDVAPFDSGVGPVTDGGGGGGGGDATMDAGVPTPDVGQPSPDIVDADMEDVERCTPGMMRRCPLAPGQVDRTYTVGRCRRGNQTCGTTGRWDPCIGQVEPIDEQCNNVDDNCNGLIDDIHQRCGNGACQIERLVCVLGRNIQCEPNLAARRDETCNGFDDDCDGMVDEGDGDAGMLQESCFTYPPEYNGRGTCRSGIRTCQRGMWGSCSDIIPQPEACNSLDDDCDGVVDNACRDE